MYKPCLEVEERGSYHLLHARLTLGDAPHLIWVFLS